jgi:hypothetical protein
LVGRLAGVRAETATTSRLRHDEPSPRRQSRPAPR